MAQSSAPHRSQRGFTLLEILVTLAVLGLLVAGLAEGMRASASAWAAQTRRVNGRADLDTTERTLRAMIARLDPGGITGRPPLFKAAPHTLSFTAALPEAISESSMRDADIALGVDPERHCLELLFSPHLGLGRDPGPVATPPAQVVLQCEVERLDLAYWQDAASGWQSEWRAPTIPRLIRLSIVFRRNGPQRVPDSVVSPMRTRWQL
jgi:prepilin-type N-terminal cleavage/methylation domain-containing protein